MKFKPTLRFKLRASLTPQLAILLHQYSGGWGAEEQAQRVETLFGQFFITSSMEGEHSKALLNANE